MGTSVGVGYSILKNPEAAGKEAARKALEQKGPGKADFVFAFATVGYNQQILVRSIREATSEAPLCGCSGEGVLTQGMVSETNFSVCVMAITSDEVKFDRACIEDITSEPDYGGSRLAAEMKPFLRSDSRAFFLFVDGVTFDFDPFRAAFEKALSPEQVLPLFGGLAGDNWAVRKTYQYDDDKVLTQGMCCVVISGDVQVAWGINHGCVPIGSRRTITRSKGNVIYEIDGIPALQALREYVEEDWATQWNKMSLNLCLGFKTPQQLKEEYGEYIVRYMIGKNDDDGSVTIQSDVSSGTSLWIVRRDKDLIRNGLKSISRQIREKTGARKPKLVMHFECMGRGKVVFREQEKIELLRSLQEDIGTDIPWIGFYTYGEIGPIATSNCIHNFTAVVTAVY
ncbi:FIST C-terminal domain-containing protein [Geomonas sp. RF6]|uniref:FIST signal transduction protein n=1 Tax=Geomonas sp. RF6 TaxID=2897342 RepID=UPI001E571EC6|nr:FIST N-terminal domain-containing protein [Geomonas sp. RF6]UFS71465.1 FIST C-terminal domain-containing protein [Geomonas sp. RF6]